MQAPTLIKVWDLPLRIFHWLLVIGFVVAYLTDEGLLTAHVWAGYTVLGLLVFRLVWGFIGNDYARFSSFLCSPIKSAVYVKDAVAKKAPRYLGHNPAGSAMIVLLMLGLLMIVMSGLVLYGADQHLGPFAGMVGKSSERLWKEIHETAANVTLLLVVGHVAGVIFESIVHRENLVKAMWNGYKNSQK
jgi:cytochrome b